MFELAMIQMHVEGGNPDANLTRAEDRLAEAAQWGAQVAVLPEALDVGWTHPSSRELAQPIPMGEPYERLRAAAVRHGIYVCAGLTERAGTATYNAAVLVDPTGQLLLHHRKLNELSIGHGCYALGERLSVTHTPLGTFGLLICADAFAGGHVLTRSLGYMGAQVILSPSAWAVPADHDNAREPYGQLWRESYGPPAKDFGMWIAGVSNVGPIAGGPWQGRQCIGCSLLVDPTGAAVVQGPYGRDAEVILRATIRPQTRLKRGTQWTGFGE